MMAPTLMQSPVQLYRLLTAQGLPAKGSSEGQGTSQAEHPGVGAAATLRKEGLFLICSKVSHGLEVIRPHGREEGRSRFLSKASPDLPCSREKGG